MQIKRNSLVSLTLASFLMLAGCSTSSPNDNVINDDDNKSSNGNSDGASSSALDISLLTTYNGLPFYTAMLCGAEDAAADLGEDIKIEFDGPRRGMNASDQIPVVESVVNRGPDGLIFVPADPQAMVASIQNAIDAGIPVVTTDGTLDEEIALAQFHGDSVAGGALAADALIEFADGRSGSVLVLDNRPGLPLTNDRANGFISELEEKADFEILPVEYFEDDPERASSIVQSKLNADPNIIGIFATAEAGATGAANALEGITTENDVHVIAYDAGPTLVNSLRNGTLDALVAQGAYQQGYDALVRIVQELRDEEPTSSSFDNVVDNVLVTASNMDDPNVAKFLYPESCN